MLFGQNDENSEMERGEKGMKVRSWRILVTTVLACGIMLAYAVHEMRQGEWVGYAWCVLGIAWLVQGFKVAFSQEKCEEQERVVSLERQVYRKFFGNLHRL